MYAFCNEYGVDCEIYKVKIEKRTVLTSFKFLKNFLTTLKIRLCMQYLLKDSVFHHFGEL